MEELAVLIGVRTSGREWRKSEGDALGANGAKVGIYFRVILISAKKMSAY